jgi:hypothetical protein
LIQGTIKCIYRHLVDRNTNKGNIFSESHHAYSYGNDYLRDVQASQSLNCLV